MKRTERLVIVIGKSFSGTDKMVSLLKDSGYDVVLPDSTAPKPIGQCNTNGADFMATNIEKYAVMDAFDGHNYGISEKQLRFSENGQAVVMATPSMAEKLFRFGMQNSISPAIIHMDTTPSEQIRNAYANHEVSGNTHERGRIDTIIEEQIANMSMPIAHTVSGGEPAYTDAKMVDALSGMIYDRHRNIPDFLTRRQEILKSGRGIDIMNKISADEMRSAQRQAFASGALGIAVAAAGAPEMGAAILAAFMLSRDGMKSFNTENAVLKNEGFTLAERIKYFAFGSLVSNEPISVASKEELDKKLEAMARENAFTPTDSIVNSVLGIIEKKFDDFVITAAGMRSVAENFKAKVVDDATRSYPQTNLYTTNAVPATNIGIKKD